MGSCLIYQRLLLLTLCSLRRELCIWVTGDGDCQLLYRQASKRQNWLVRIEDTDTERCHPTFSNLILADLERLGFALGW